MRQRFDECESGPFEFTMALSQRDGRGTEVRWTGTCVLILGAEILRGLVLDVTEVRRLNRELAAAQKLESVGRLAAGVAHEINTPVQFVADNMNFLCTSMSDMAEVIKAYRGLRSTVESGSDAVAATQAVAAAEANARS